MISNYRSYNIQQAVIEYGQRKIASTSPGINDSKSSNMSRYSIPTWPSHMLIPISGNQIKAWYFYSGGCLQKLLVTMRWLFGYRANQPPRKQPGDAGAWFSHDPEFRKRLEVGPTPFMETNPSAIQEKCKHGYHANGVCAVYWSKCIKNADGDVMLPISIHIISTDREFDILWFEFFPSVYMACLFCSMPFLCQI